MTNKKNNEPVISEAEMKMPEEQFGAGVEVPADGPSYLGLVLAGLIVILVLLLAGLYLWSTTLNNIAPVETTPVTRPTTEENNEPESTKAEAEVETLEVLSTSDELGAIEADLESTDLDALDTELNAIDAELENALQ